MMVIKFNLPLIVSLAYHVLLLIYRLSQNSVLSGIVCVFCFKFSFECVTSITASIKRLINLIVPFELFRRYYDFHAKGCFSVNIFGLVCGLI